MESEAGAVNYIPVPLMSQEYPHADPCYAADPYMVNFDHYDSYVGYATQPEYPVAHGGYVPDSHSPHSPRSPSDHSRTSPPLDYMRKGPQYVVDAGYNDMEAVLNPALQDHYRITPSPGGPGDQYGE